MKSYVTMETAVCPVCGKEEDTGAILMDTRLRERFAHRTATGWGMCAEHRELYRDGYMAIVECKDEPHGDRIQPDQANRTGRIVHLAFGAAMQIFTGLPRREDGKPAPMVFAPPEVVDKVLRIMAEHGVEPLAPADRPKPEGQPDAQGV